MAESVASHFQQPHALRLCAALMAGLLSFSALAQETAPSPEATKNTPSVIVRPEQPSTLYTIDENDKNGSYVTKLGPLLSRTLSQLDTHLKTLHDLDNASNARALNELGKNYGNAATLGTDLNSTLSSLDVNAIHHDTDTLANNVNTGILDYAELYKDFTQNMLGGIDAQSLSISSPNPGISDFDADVKRKMQGLRSITDQFKNLVELNNAVSALNANLESVAKTSDQLILLSARRPSELVAIADLSGQISKFHNLINSQFKIVDALHEELGMVNATYTALHDSGGAEGLGSAEKNVPVSAALAATNRALEAFSGHVKGANQQMSIFLGLPKTSTLIAGPDGIKLPPMSEDMRAIVAGAQKQALSERDANPPFNPLSPKSDEMKEMMRNSQKDALAQHDAEMRANAPTAPPMTEDMRHAIEDLQRNATKANASSHPAPRPQPPLNP